jgi:uncharacterized protein (DUF2384 family)
MASTKKTPDPSSPDDRALADKAAIFRRRKTIEELAAEQGVSLPQDLDAMIGEGKDLWDSDEEFEAWLEDLQEARREGR